MFATPSPLGRSARTGDVLRAEGVDWTVQWVQDVIVHARIAVSATGTGTTPGVS
jgi:hypothetical protein